MVGQEGSNKAAAITQASGGAVWTEVAVTIDRVAPRKTNDPVTSSEDAECFVFREFVCFALKHYTRYS